MTLEEINHNLYKSAEHLFEASRYMSNFNGKRALEMAAEADIILSVIQPVEQKVSSERLDEVLGEIMEFEGGKS